jgi:hypothetical protein
MPPRTQKNPHRRSAFVIEYLKDFNAGAAMQRCGVKAVASARTIGYKLLQEPEVQAALAEVLKRRAEKADVTAEEVVVFFTGIMRNIGEKTAERTRAAENLGKHLGLFKEQPPPPPMPTAAMQMDVKDLAKMTDEDVTKALGNIERMIAALTQAPVAKVEP